MKEKSINVLMVDDSENDVLLIIRQLKKGGYHPIYERVDTAAAMKTALQEKQWDIILCDYKMPHFDAPAAIALFKKINLDIPLIVVSGTIGEETAVECMRLGAQDYLMKSNLSRLCPAISRELKDAIIRTQQRNFEHKLHAEEQRFRVLTEQSSDIILLINRDSTITYANPETERALGLPKEEIIGSNMYQYLHPDEVSLIGGIFDRFFKDTRPVVQKAEIRISNKDGTWHTVEAQGTNLIQDNEVLSVVVNIRDITDRKKAEENLFIIRKAVESSSDAIGLSDPDGNHFYHNEAFTKLFGYSPAELHAKGDGPAIYADRHTARSVFEAIKSGDSWSGEAEFISKNGGRILALTRADAIKDDSGRIIGLIGIHSDITERKKMEEALKQSEALYRLLADNISEHIWIMDLNFNFTHISPSVEKIYGYSVEEVRRFKINQLFTEESFKKFSETLSNKLAAAMVNPPPETGTRRILELQARHKIGHLIWIETRVSFIRDENGKPVSILGETREITERKLAQDELQKSEERYRTILEDINDGYFEIDLAGNFTFFNDMVCKDTGYSRSELMGMNNRQYIDEKDLPDVFRVYNKVYTTGEPEKDFTWQIKRKDGTKINVEAYISLMRDASGKPIGFRGIARNITERKMAEKLLKESEERYRLLADHMKDQIWLMDMKMNITYVSPSVERLTGYSSDEIRKMSWKKLLTRDSMKRAADFIAIQMPKAMKASSDYLFLKTLELEFVLKNGQTIWGECAFSFVRDEKGEILSILGEARNVTERKLAEEKLQKTLDSLKRAVGTTIQVLVTALEARDPYTAGHQSRSSDLACAIAEEMGLDNDRIEGIRMAGTIHDIGKLSIPAEILTKPGKLTNIEFSLIKEHSRIGYDMLKDVDSPWPLADIVRQHHERMNGSGYPDNLKGDDILIEARILAVADVVEAMGSHRPYRASLGIEAALAEIEQNKGILYDTETVDACLKLFHEKGYHLP
ncbi:MAG: PAS domain S-box protein [Smithella sp.]|nr:PAS domain S-box protein [Smithella sp.]